MVDVVCWCKPNQGWVKINVDASMRPNQGSVGLGFAARDHSVVLLFAGPVFVQSCRHIQLAKAMVIPEDLIEAKHYGISRIVVESDTLIVANLLNSN